MDGPVIAAIIAAASAVVVYFLGQRQASLERRRKACAEAVADALAWLELPYRIRRRLDNTKEALGALVERIHHLQERLAFHESWLRVELPQAHKIYRELLDSVRASARSALQDAWRASPMSDAAEMNIGDLGLQPVDSLVESFSQEVRKHLAIWRVWE